MVTATWRLQAEPQYIVYSLQAVIGGIKNMYCLFQLCPVFFFCPVGVYCPPPQKKKGMSSIYKRCLVLFSKLTDIYSLDSNFQEFYLYVFLAEKLVFELFKNQILNLKSKNSGFIILKRSFGRFYNSSIFNDLKSFIQLPC